MIDNKKWIQQSGERKKLARKLIDMGAKDFEEFDELKDVPVEILQTWIIEALEEQNTNLQEMLKVERSVTCKEEYLKTVTELEEKLANADYQLEGRDLEIKELKAQLERELKLNQCLSDHNEQLRELIKQMKCCFNCRHSRTEYEHCRTNKHEKWEIKEK